MADSNGTFSSDTDHTDAVPVPQGERPDTPSCDHGGTPVGRQRKQRAILSDEVRRGRLRILLILAIMIGVAATVGVTTIHLLYRAALSEERARLRELAQSQARLIEAVAEFDMMHYADGPRGSAEATLSQVRRAHERFEGFGLTGEFVLGRREQDRIEILLRHRGAELTVTPSIPFESELAQPMRQALLGRAGMLIGRDYLGATVLAAFEPVRFLGLGIVAKIDLSEVREPFVRAGLIAGCCGLASLAAGTLLLLRVGGRLVASVAEHESRYRGLFEASFDPICIAGMDGRLRRANPACERVLGYERAELLARPFYDFIHPDDHDRTKTEVEKLARGHRTVDFEINCVRKDGVIRTVSWTAVPLLPERLMCAVGRDVTERREAEQTLRHSEQRYRTLFDNMKSGVTVFRATGDGADFIISGFNRAAQKIEQIAAEEVLERRVTEAFPGISESGFLATLRRVWETGIPESPPPFFYEDSRISGWRDNDIYKLPTGEVVAVYDDITERLLSEKQIRLQSAALNAAANAIVITDPNGTILWVNSAFSALTGYGVEEVVGGIPRILKSGKHDAAFYRHMWKTILAGKVWHGETVNRRKDGSLYTEEMTITPVKDEHGAVTHFIAIKQDVTARKQTEASLRESEAQFRAISETAQDAIIMIDNQGRVIYWNAAAEAILGYTAEEALDQDAHQLLAPEWYHAGHQQAFPRFQETGLGPAVGRTLELSAITKAGDEIPVELSLSALQIKGRWCAIGILRDLAERKRAEADRLKLLKVQHKRKHFENAVKAHERVLGVVGHELRTPLGSVRAMAEYLVGETDRGGPIFDEFLTCITSECQRMADLLDDLLEVARLNSGRARWRWSEFCVRQTCEEAVATIRPLVKEPDVSLEMAVEPPEMTMRGDAAAIRRLIVNLLSNAQKHTSAGSIQVRVQALSRDEQEWLRLVVSDTGEGMPENIAERLGVPFALNSGVIGGPHVRGSGLGLTICKGIVAAHGGTVSVSTKQGRGTTVEIMLRRDLQEPGAPEGAGQIACEVQV